MDEASKTKKIWNEQEWSYLIGSGIDIGAGPDPVKPDVRRFDIDHGDANEITKYVNEQFDYVFSSHCLEHMHNPRNAILQWWQLVKPGGVLFFLVPEEDLYEQGVFPSRFNPDHKATFTISKRASWSPVSVNVLDLCRSLPDGEIVSIELNDIRYDRSRHLFGKAQTPNGFLSRFARRLTNRLRVQFPSLGSGRPTNVVDQTQENAFAQIQAIVRKRPSA